MNPARNGDGPSWRDWDAINRDIEALRRKLDSVSVILVDAQVRIAKIETIRIVSHDEFEPIKRVVWGAVTTILTLTLIALLALVLNKTGTLGGTGKL